MPEYEVVERHSTFVQAPAEVTLAAACEMDFDESRIVRTIFKGRELLLHGQPAGNELPRGLLAKTKALGWGVLAEVPGREIVMGAVTQPWVANAKFRTLAPEQFKQFTSFQDPEYVKIAWTLRADPVTAMTSIFSHGTTSACLRSYFEVQVQEVLGFSLAWNRLDPARHAWAAETGSRVPRATASKDTSGESRMTRTLSMALLNAPPMSPMRS